MIMRLLSKTIATFMMGLMVLLCASDVLAKASKSSNSIHRQVYRISKFDFGTPKTLKLEMALAKKDVIAYEPILLTITFKNVSDHVLDVFMPIHLFGRCEVIAPDGTKLLPELRYFDGIAGGCKTEDLQPGKSFSGEFDLLDYFDMGKQTGTYIINYRYELIEAVRYVEGNQSRPGTRRIGQLTAKQEVKVEVPKSDVDKQALALFRPAVNAQFSRRASERVVKSYEQIIKEYPTSKYAELASYYLAQLYDYAYTFELAIKHYEDFILKYPISFYAKAARQALKDVQERAIREKALIEKMEKSESQKSKEQKNQK